MSMEAVERPVAATSKTSPRPKMPGMDLTTDDGELQDNYRLIGVGTFDQNPNLHGDEVAAARKLGSHLVEHVREDAAKLMGDMDADRAAVVAEAALMYVWGIAGEYNKSRGNTVHSVPSDLRSARSADDGVERAVDAMTPNATKAREFAKMARADGLVETASPVMARAIKTKRATDAQIGLAVAAGIDNNPALTAATKTGARMIFMELNGAYALSLSTAAALVEAMEGATPGKMTNPDEVRKVAAMGAAAAEVFAESAKIASEGLQVAAADHEAGRPVEESPPMNCDN